MPRLTARAARIERRRKIADEAGCDDLLNEFLARVEGREEPYPPHIVEQMEAAVRECEARAAAAPPPPPAPPPGPHPDHGPPELLPRRDDGSLPLHYHCSHAELAAAGIDPAEPPALRVRSDGWTPDRQRDFIEALAATASVSDAAAAVGMSPRGAYKLYNRSAAFRAAWDAALHQARAVLAATAFDRAVNGVEEKVYQGGRFVGHRRRYNDRLLIHLLRVRDPLNFAPLDDLHGWQRHRAVEPSQDLGPALDRLEAAERDWASAHDRAPDLRGAADLLDAPDADDAPLLSAPPAER